jgi:hypothetical protein
LRPFSSSARGWGRILSCQVLWSKGLLGKDTPKISKVWGLQLHILRSVEPITCISEACCLTLRVWWWWLPLSPGVTVWNVHCQRAGNLVRGIRPFFTVTYFSPCRFFSFWCVVQQYNFLLILSVDVVYRIHSSSMVTTWCWRIDICILDRILWKGHNVCVCVCVCVCMCVCVCVCVCVLLLPKLYNLSLITKVPDKPALKKTRISHPGQSKRMLKKHNDWIQWQIVDWDPELEDTRLIPLCCGCEDIMESPGANTIHWWKNAAFPETGRKSSASSTSYWRSWPLQ